MDTSIWVCAFVVLWCNTGLHMILFSAAMTSIPAEIYESAKIRRRHPFQKLRYITLPLLKGTINMSAILLLTNAFRVFDLIAALTDGGPGYSSQVLTTLIYKKRVLLRRVRLCGRYWRDDGYLQHYCHGGRQQAFAK